MTPPVFTLDRFALRRALHDQRDTFGLGSVEAYGLDHFSENGARAIKELAICALDEWHCLSQPQPSGIDVGVYALDTEYENSILITVRGKRCATVQASSLTVDANRLAPDQYTRSGPDLLAEVLEAVVSYANELAPYALAMLSAAGPSPHCGDSRHTERSPLPCGAGVSDCQSLTSRGA